MTPKEAADRLRPNFHLESMPPEDRHHVIFVEAVTAELGVEPTPFNLHQVAAALDHADIHPDDNQYPKMLYSRQHHAEDGCSASIYDPRHDWCWAHVENEEQAKALGSGWVESPADLPPRGETPIDAPVTVLENKPVAHVENADPAAPRSYSVTDGPAPGSAPYFEPPFRAPKSHPDSAPDKLTGVGAGNVGVAKPEDAKQPVDANDGF